MKLTRQERAWLDTYKRHLGERYPGTVAHMLIYGSKARGEGHSESDLDVLLIVKNSAAGLKRELRRVGYLLGATSEVLPSILAYTENEWESRKKSGSPFRRAVERDAVSVF